jgi:hypothetical protein
VGFQNGFYLSLWGSKSLNAEAPTGNFGNEIDYAFGWAGQVGPLGVNLSVAYWDFSDPFLFQGHNDVVQFALELNKAFKFGDHLVMPYVKIEPTFSLGSEPYGAYLHVGLRHRLSLADRIAFMHSGRVVYDTGVYGLTPGYNFRYDAAFSFDLSKSITLRLPMFRTYHLITNFEDRKKNYYVYGSGVDVRF